MSTPLRWSVGFVILVTAAAWIAATADIATSQESSKKKPSDAKRELEPNVFMRQKLEASGQILEGLTTEDAETIIKGAKTLVDMSAAEKWHVRTDAMYRQFSNEFQRSAKNLLEAAEKKNYDTVALKWIDVTMKCLECHKFVRGTRLVDNGR